MPRSPFPPSPASESTTWRCLEAISRKLDRLNDTQMATGLPPLQLADVTWEWRARELRARVNLLAADGPSFDLLASLGAHVLAALLALDRAEMVDVASGEAT